jgi:hypothetical protein
MASYQKFEDFVEQLVLGKHDLSAAGHVLKLYLTNATPSASADAVKADLAEFGQSGSGYTAGGQDVQNTVSETTGTVTIGATDVVWTASADWTGNPFRYVVLYNDTQTSPADPLIAWWDYGSSITLLNTETFTVDFTNLFTLA